jgi:dTDP-4-dehydrorhamnose reductase
MDDALIVRTSWLYSHYGNNFVLSILRLLREKKRLEVIADQVGTPTWASTLAEAIWSATEKPRLKGIYHWTDTGVASWYDFAVAIQEEALMLGILDRSIPVIPIKSDQYPTDAKRPFYSVLDIYASLHEIDIPHTHWRVALRKMLSILKSTY